MEDGGVEEVFCVGQYFAFDENIGRIGIRSAENAF